MNVELDTNRLDIDFFQRTADGNYTQKINHEEKCEYYFCPNYYKNTS